MIRSLMLILAIALTLVGSAFATPTTGTQSTPGWPMENPSATEVANAASGTTALIDWTQGPNQKVTLTGACTFTFTAPTYPGICRVKLVQDATGSRVVTWPAAVKWASGTAPTLTTTAAHIDIIYLYFDGTNYYGTSVLDVH